MKKTVRYIKIFIVFILLYLLQSNLFTWFTIAGIQPNLFIIFILLCGLFTGSVSGLICGVVCGILLDLFIQIDVIIEPIILGITGFAAGILARNFSTESRMNIMMMTIATTFFYELLAYVLKIIIYTTSVEIGAFLRIVIIEMIYNAFIVIIAYPIVQKINKKKEDRFLENRILKYY